MQTYGYSKITGGAEGGGTDYMIAAPNGANLQTVEARAQFASPGARTIKEAGVFVGTNTRGVGESVTITLRVAGSSTALTVTIPGGSTGFFSIPGTLNVANGALIAWQLVRTAAAGAYQFAANLAHSMPPT